MFSNQSYSAVKIQRFVKISCNQPSPIPNGKSGHIIARKVVPPKAELVPPAFSNGAKFQIFLSGCSPFAHIERLVRLTAVSSMESWCSTRLAAPTLLHDQTGVFMEIEVSTNIAQIFLKSKTNISRPTPV